MGKKNKKRVSKRKGNHVKSVKLNTKQIIAVLTGFTQAVYWLYKLYKELNDK